MLDPALIHSDGRRLRYMHGYFWRSRVFRTWLICYLLVLLLPLCFSAVTFQHSASILTEKLQASAFSAAQQLTDLTDERMKTIFEISDAISISPVIRSLRRYTPVSYTHLSRVVCGGSRRHFCRWSSGRRNKPLPKRIQRKCAANILSLARRRKKVGRKSWLSCSAVASRSRPVSYTHLCTIFTIFSQGRPCFIRSCRGGPAAYS